MRMAREILSVLAHPAWAPSAAMLLLAGCASHRAPLAAVDAAPPVEVAAAPALPPGATPGMLVPQALADGSFPTPNRGLAGAAAIWHLRSGLNVAALACPGEEGAAICAGYNAWLTRDKAPLARAATAYAAQYRAKGAPVDGYDDAMTRLYNFFSQTPVRPGLCTAAAAILAEVATVDAAALPGFAEERLAVLDRPFIDFYRAYAAWRDGNAARMVIATAATPPPTPVAVAAVPPARANRPAPPRRPALLLDLSTLPADTEVTAR